MSAAYCPYRFCKAVLEQRMDQLGRVTDICRQCDRRLAGICRDCDGPVEGTIGRALRCATHKKSARTKTDRGRMRDPDIRRKKNAQWRKYSRREEVRARRLDARRAWRAANPDAVRRYKRQYLLKQSPTYLATQRRHNQRSERIAKKREAALAAYYLEHPVRPDPHCTGCGAPIAWTPGKGRPRLTCDACCTPAELRRRVKGYNRRPRRKAAA